MSIRRYSGLLLFEDVLDYIPRNDPSVYTLAELIMAPYIQIVTEDCGTTLGKREETGYDSEGKVELATDEVLNQARIIHLLAQGRYNIAVRASSHCIAHQGLCKKCFEASFPGRGAVSIGDRVKIEPEYILQTQVIQGEVDQDNWPIELQAQYYDFAIVWTQGEMMSPGDYTITDEAFYINGPLTQAQTFVIQYRVMDRRPFLYHLADTYSGSMIGMRPLPSPPLPIRKSLIESLLTPEKLEAIVEYTGRNNNIGSDVQEYLGKIKSPFEQAMLAIVLNCIYNQVTS